MDSASASSSVSGWYIAGIAALVVGVACFLLLAWRLRKRKTTSAAPDLAGSWKKAVAAMPRAEQDGPVVIVLGERLAGKSTLVRGALGSCDRYTQDGSDLDVYAGGGQRVQEISGDVLLDPRKEAEDELRKLWKAVALSAVRVVVAVNARSLTWNRTGLRDLGRVVRRKIDLLEELRGAPVNVRVAVTHLDERSPGFVPLCKVLEETGERRPIPHDTPGAAIAGWKRVAPRGAGTRALPAVVDFVATEGGAGTEGASALRSLAPFFEMLLAPAKDAPVVDGVFLCAAPPEEPFSATGDALATDEGLAERDARARWVRGLWRAALAVGALVLAAALFVTFQKRAVERTDRAVTALDEAVRSGAPVSRSLEGRAAEEVRRMRRSAVLYPDDRADIERTYAAAVRDGKLLPRLRSPDRGARLRALAVLDAGQDEGLRAAIDADRTGWAKALDMSPETLDVYLSGSDGGGVTDKELAELSPIAAPPIGSSLEDWKSFFDRVSKVLGGERLTEARLGALQTDARGLSAAVDSAAAQVELAEVTRILEERHPQYRDRFATGAAMDAGPWIKKNTAGLRSILQIVLAGSLGDRTGAGKGLREAVSDLAVLSVLPVFVLEEPAEEPAAAEPRKSWLDRLEDLFAPAASAAASAAPSALPAAPPASASPSASASSSTSASASGTTSASAGAGAAKEEGPSYPVLSFTIESRSWTIDSELWAKAIVTGRALRYLDALFADAGTRSVLFPAGASPAPVVPSGGRGPTQFIDGRYTHEAFVSEVSPGLQGFEKALDGAGLSSLERQTYLVPTRSAAADHAKGLRAALDAYYQSFRLSSGGTAALAADVADIVSPASFMTDFLKTTADTATMPAEPSALLRPIADKVADYGPILRLTQGENGKMPALEPYFKLLIGLIPSLSDKAPPAPPKDAPLEARLAPIGSLAFSALRDPAKSIHADVEAWLNDAAIPEGFRAPFRLAPRKALALGKADVERAVADAWARELRPSVSPLLDRFPFNSRSGFDAQAADVEATFGPKGTFFASFASLVGPVVREGPPGTFTPLEVPTAGAVQVPKGALRLASWATRLSGLLFGADGKPQPIALQVKAPPLSPVERERTITFAFVIAGSSSFYAFNQAPSWQPFPVVWSPGDAGPGRASVGIQTMSTGGGEPRIQTIDASPSDFAFFRLLQREQTQAAGANVTWEFPPEVTGGPKRYAAFLFSPSPVGLLSAPSLD